VPPTHCEQLAEPAAAKKPRSHGAHTSAVVEPALPVAVPAGQAKQTEAPVTFM
jgi:hypothetical protein